MTEEGWLAESLQRKNAMEKRFHGRIRLARFFLNLSAPQSYLGDTRIPGASEIVDSFGRIVWTLESYWGRFRVSLPRRQVETLGATVSHDTYFFQAGLLRMVALAVIAACVGSIHVVGAPGSLLWAFQTNDGVISSPTMGVDGTIYIGSDDGKVYALDGKIGAKKWDYQTGGRVRSTPAVGPDGTVYVGSYDTKMYALNKTTGAKLWEFATGGEILSSPALGPSGTLYFGSGYRDVGGQKAYDGKIYAIDARTGVEIWRYQVQSTRPAVWGSAAIAEEGTIYIGASDNSVYALHGKTGARVWQDQFGGDVWAPALLGNGFLCAGGGTHFRALNTVTGAMKWDYDTGISSDGSPVVGPDGTVYFGDDAGKLHAVDGGSGLKKWSFDTGWEIDSTPAIAADGTIYTGSGNGGTLGPGKSLYALDSITGTMLWKYKTGGGVYSSPAIGTDGTVYFGSDDGKVYAVTGTAGLARSPWPMFRNNPQRTGFGGGGGIQVPVITQQPQSQIVAAGAAVVFSVAAIGTLPFSYQWQWNGIDLPGATGLTLKLANVTVGQAGVYIVVISNSAGSTSSQLTSLNVNPVVLPPLTLKEPEVTLSGKFICRITGSEGQKVVLLGSADLVHWTTVVTNTLTVGGAYFVDDRAFGAIQRFYCATPLSD